MKHRTIITKYTDVPVTITWIDKKGNAQLLTCPNDKFAIRAMREAKKRGGSCIRIFESP